MDSRIDLSAVGVEQEVRSSAKGPSSRIFTDMESGNVVARYEAACAACERSTKRPLGLSPSHLE